jgi:hypothetical protein
MRMIRQGLALALLVTWIGCGGDDTTPVISGNGKSHHTDAGDDDPSEGRGRLDGGSDASISGGGDGSVDPGADAPDPRAPDVMLLAPTPADDPNSDTLITTDTFVAKCKVTRSEHADSHSIDQATVRIEGSFLADPERPDKITVLTAAVKALEDNTFEAEFNLTDVPNGPINFTCSASDTGAPAITGKGIVHTFLDLGPTVEILEPKDGSAHALETKVLVKFRVTKAPVDIADSEATPKDVQLVVSGQTFEAEEDKKDPGLYTVSIDFNDGDKYPMTPTTAEVVVSASNKRTPDAPTRRALSAITLDSDGPKITINSPARESMVGADVLIQISVSDPSGVNLDSLIGTISLADKVYTLKNWKTNKGILSTRLDTRAFGTVGSQFTIVFNVEDMVGNPSETSVILFRDTVKPLVSLDPPPIYEYRIKNADTPDEVTTCSAAFDPVGSIATNDLDVKPESSLYRALVLDGGNYTPGEVYPRKAGVNNNSVTLYAQRYPGTSFLIDTDGDTKCDDVQVELVDNKGKDISPTPLQLYGLSKRGKAPFTHDAVVPNGCETVAADETEPTLCDATEMHRIIPQPGEVANQPAIFAMGQPLNGTTGPCTGDSWEALLNVGEGWRCFAARAEDGVGNVGISKPLRVCFDDNNAANGTPNCDSAIAPTCLDHCTLPDNLDLPPNYPFLER